MAIPNRTFAVLVLFAIGLFWGIGWSARHLLVAGAPTLGRGGAWPSVDCLFLPLAGDFLPHLGSYLFLAAIAAGSTAGVRALARQQTQTRALLRCCLAVRSASIHDLHSTTRTLELDGRVDVVDLTVPVVFCYGYLRPRVLIVNSRPI